MAQFFWGEVPPRTSRDLVSFEASPIAGSLGVLPFRECLAALRDKQGLTIGHQLEAGLMTSSYCGRNWNYSNSCNQVESQQDGSKHGRLGAPVPRQ